MKLSYLLFFLYFFSPSHTVAQETLSNAQIDSIFKVGGASFNQKTKASYELSKKMYWASKKNNYQAGMAFGLYKISRYHSDVLNDYNKALAYNDKGYQIARKIDNDSLMLFFTFGKSLLYGKLGFNEEAIKIIDKCFDKTDHIKNYKKRSLFRADLYTSKAYCLAKLDPPASSKEILKYCIAAMKESEKALDLCINPGYSNVGIYYLENKKYDSASYYLNKGIRFSKAKNKNTCEVEYIKLSDLNFTIGHPIIAIKYLDSSNAICLKKPVPNYFLISENYGRYTKIYSKLDTKDSIIKYQNLQQSYKDSLAIQSQKKLKESFKYMVSKSEHENNQLEQNRQILIWSAIIGVLVVLFIIIYYKRINNALRHMTMIKEKDFEKDLIQKSTEIQHLKHQISTSYDELIEMAKKDNPLFVNFFRELYPVFYQKLKDVQPNLTILEQKICFYLKLKFTTTEIADYTFVSVKAIQNRKNRLRKRLFIEDGKDIYDWMDSLDK